MAKPRRSSEEESPNEKKTSTVSTFVNAVVYGLNADWTEYRPPKIATCGSQCCMVDVIRLTITWQCDMIVNTVGRHSGRSTFRHGAGQTDIPSDFYI